MGKTRALLTLKPEDINAYSQERKFLYTAGSLTYNSNVTITSPLVRRIYFKRLRYSY